MAFDPPKDPSVISEFLKNIGGFEKLAKSEEKLQDFFEIIYQVYSYLIYKYIMRLLGGDETLAWDLLQETFLNAWRFFRTLKKIESISQRHKEELVHHTETCSTCRKAYEEYLIPKALQTTANMNPLPNVRFRQILALEQERINKRCSIIRKRDLVFAALYGSCVPLFFYGLFILIWPRCESTFKGVFSNSPAFTGILIQTLVIYLLNVITCRFTQAFLKASCRKTYGKFTRQIGGILVMCSALATSVIFAYATGINPERFLPLLIIGSIPYDVSRKMKGKLRIEAIFWGITIRGIPHSLLQLEIPLVRQIGDIAESIKSFQWI